MYHKLFICMLLLAPLGFSSGIQAAEKEDGKVVLGEIVVEGEMQKKISVDTSYTSPSTIISKEEAAGINAATIEDVIKYEPSLVVRRRYIGDPNGTVGIRGTGMFQTARTMVFADGLPLHYLLQTRWGGAPRWSLVSADETESIEVIYGPFSAEYSGNAMGGVVNINTKLPDKFIFNAEVGIFSQNFKYMGTDDTFTGHSENVSVGDRFGKLSIYMSHNHLENKSQPMSFRSDNTLGTPAGGETVVSGAYRSTDSRENAAIYYGDSGPETAITDLTKIKVGYEMGDWLARFTLAYEDRSRETNSPKNYLTDTNGDLVWSGDAAFNDELFTIRESHFAVSQQERESLLLGAALEGPIGDSDWMLETNISHFDVIKDEIRSSSYNPASTNDDGSGRVSEFNDTGWITLDVKARTDNFLDNKDMNFITGYHYDHYRLKIDSYSSNNYAAGEKTTLTGTSGGDTMMHAAFVQWGWQFKPQWDLALGARYEYWTMKNGKDGSAPPVDIVSRSETGFSPKFSLGYAPDSKWKYRYSLAKAYRFPIVEELYHNEKKTNSTSIANDKLQPEDGIHQNIMFERQLAQGFMRINVFHEVIKNVIFNQSIDVNGSTVSTFLPIDEVTTKGIEYIVQRKHLFGGDVDARFNLTWLDSKITKHSSEPSVEGNQMSRIPEWRSNLFLTYHVNNDWDASGGLRYVSNSYSRLDNTDTATNVQGAVDGYLFLDLKISYSISKTGKVAFGIDNVTDELAFVSHPWPHRTYYIKASFRI